MSGFKRSQPGLRFSAEKISPDEIDRYEIYNIVGPGTSIAFYFLGTSGTADVKAVTFLSTTPDYPRNVQFQITGSAAGMAGSLDLNGYDQFGSVITETMGFGSTDNGGSVIGTKVFGQLTSGTIRYGTFAGANGTSRIGLSSAGTTTLFGLPVKLNGTTDLVHFGAVGGTDAIPLVNNGTIGTYAVVGVSAVRAPKPVTGTMTMVAWVRSRFVPDNIPVVAAGTQIL